MIGFAFLSKMAQAFLVLPAFTLVYLIAAPTPVRRRILQLIAGAGAMIASAGWWVARGRTVAFELRGPTSTARRRTASLT